MIYLDSCTVIYLVERHPAFHEALDARFRRHAGNFMISPLVMLECLVKPLKDGDTMLQADFERFFALVRLVSMPNEVYLNAARKRAAHGVKTPDALHLATAEHHGCVQFWTNDD
jgi:uncharacterized protein